MNSKTVAENGSDSEDSYELVNYDQIEGKPDSIEDTTKKLETLKLDTTKEEQPSTSAPQIEGKEDHMDKFEDDECPKDKKVEEEREEEDKSGTIVEDLKQRCFKFLKEVNVDDLKTVFLVAKTLIQNNSEFENALITALQTTDSVYKHPLIQDLIPILPLYSKKIEGWLPVLANLDFELLITLLPNLANCATSQNKTCEIDMRDVFASLCPQQIQQLESKIPKNEERCYKVDPKHVSESLKTAEKSLNEEFPEKVVHKGVECDVCGQSPLIGVRYKCAVRQNYDLCSKCIDKHPQNYPSIRINIPVVEIPPLLGLREFVNKTQHFDHRPSPHHGHHPLFPLHFGRGRHHQWRVGRGFMGMRDVNSEERKQTGLKRKETSTERQKKEIKRLKKEAKEFRKELKKACKEEKKKHVENKRNKRKELRMDILTGNDTKLMTPSSVCLFQWTVKNVGTVDWGKATKAVFVKGNKDLLAGLCELDVGSCKVGETVKISSPLFAPANPGKYSVYFTLVDETRFGKFLCAQIQVEMNEESENEEDPMVIEDGEEKTEVATSMEEDNKSTEKPFDHGEQLKQLKMMGFDDEQMLKAVLVAHGGNLERSLAVLLG